MAENTLQAATGNNKPWWESLLGVAERGASIYSSITDGNGNSNQPVTAAPTPAPAAAPASGWMIGGLDWKQYGPPILGIAVALLAIVLLLRKR